MSELYYRLNGPMKVSIILFLIPFFIGGYIEEKYNIKTLYLIIIFFIPFYFWGIKSIISQLRLFMSINYTKLLILFILYSILTITYTLDVYRGISSIALLIISIFIGILISRFNLLEIYKFVAWSGLFYSLVLYFGLPKIYFSYEEISNRFGHFYGDIRMNPNIFSILLNFIAIYFLYKIINAKSRISFFINIIPLIATCLLLIETQSRSGFFTFILIVLLTFLFKINKYTIVFNTFAISMLSLLILLNINYDLNNRLSDVDLNNRGGIWEVGIDKALENPYNMLFGYGLGSAELAIGESYGGFTIIDEDGLTRASAHNMYIENLLNLGVVGLILFLFTFISLLVYIYKNFKYSDSYLPLSVLLIIIIGGVTGNVMRSYFFILFFALVIAYTIQKKKGTRIINADQNH